MGITLNEMQWQQRNCCCAAGFKGLSSVRLLAASADALALLRFDMEVQHARAPNNSALPGAVLCGLPLHRRLYSQCTWMGRACNP